MFQTGFVLGFLAAIAVGVAIGGLLGSARLARVFGLLAGSRTANRSTRPAAVANAPEPTTIEADVIPALVTLRAPAAAARQATLAAARTAPQEFEPLFQAALALMPRNAARKAVA